MDKDFIEEKECEECGYSFDDCECDEETDSEDIQ